MTNYDIFRYFLYLGFAGFGGPLAIIEYIRKELVQEKKWMTAEEFRNFLGYSQIAPGPLAFQVALYFSYFKKGFWAAVLAGLGLVLPSYIIVLLFSVFYKEFRDINYIAWGLYGISPIIISIILYSGYNLSRTVFHKDVFQYIMFFSAIAVSVFFKLHIILLILLFALISLVYYSSQKIIKEKKLYSVSLFSVSGLIIFASSVYGTILSFINLLGSKLADIMYVFMKAGGLTYGSGFVIIGVLRQDVVTNYGWLTAKEFLDGIAFGQITPGPVVITSTFIGYIVSGIPGSLVATVSVFLPTFVFVLLISRVIEKIKDNFFLKSAINGANAASIGAIITTGYFLAWDAIIDYWSMGLFLISLAILFKYNIRPYYLIVLGALAGIIIKSII